MTVIWADNAIENQWLQVTVLAGADTGLATADVFCFGNLVGESGNDATVTVADEDAALNNRTGFVLASITNNYDYNRDGRVNAADALIARSTYTGPQATLQLITAPVGAPPAGEDSLQPVAQPAAPPGDISASAATETALGVNVNTSLIKNAKNAGSTAYGHAASYSSAVFAVEATAQTCGLNAQESFYRIEPARTAEAGVIETLSWRLVDSRQNLPAQAGNSLHDAVFTQFGETSSSQDCAATNSSGQSEIDASLDDFLSHKVENSLSHISDVRGVTRHKYSPWKILNGR